MQTQKDLVNMHPCHGIMNIDVLSFVRLSYRVFEETGGGTLPVLDDEGKNLILRKIAGDYEGELKVLGGNHEEAWVHQRGEVSHLEFAQYDNYGRRTRTRHGERRERNPGYTTS